MNTFTAHTQRQQGKIGVTLRGNCTDITAAELLEKAVADATTYGLAVIWIDCQRLNTITWQGQRAILNANQRARAAGVSPRWCGIPTPILEQFAVSGLGLLLSLEPASSYQGPPELLLDYLSPSTRIRLV